MRLTILGSGTSHGIPVLACTCPVCRSADPRDVRYRSAGWISDSSGLSLLIDAGPELRLQGLRAGIDRLDAVLLTHPHADHLHGLDDLRPLCAVAPLPLYGNTMTIGEVRERFAYVFKETQLGGGKPKFELCDVDQPFSLGGVAVIPLPLMHGTLPILGWRIGDLAWMTDCTEIPETTYQLLRGLDCLVLGALRDRPHPTHFSFRQATDAALRIGARRTYLTHLCHAHSHREAQDIVFGYASDANPASHRIDIAYDGLTIDIP